jgi:hypothetical protein
MTSRWAETVAGLRTRKTDYKDSSHRNELRPAHEFDAVVASLARICSVRAF